jgi:hypothetical protein
MYFKYVVLICAVVTLAGAQATTNLGYPSNGMPATPILPSSSPLIATPVMTSTTGQGNNGVGATNGTGANIAGASNATGSNIAGASNSTLTMVPGAGAPVTNISTYAEMPPSAPFGSKWQTGMQQELLSQGPVYLEFGAMRSDSVYDRFGANPLTLAEAAQIAKEARQTQHALRIYTNADIERVERESGVKVPARAMGQPAASNR